MVDFAAIQAVPAGTANGAPLPNVPVNAIGVVLYIPAAATPGNSVTYAVASAQPTSPPTTVQVTGQIATAPGLTTVFTERLNPGQNLYVTAGGANCSFRWLQGG
ncbi:MAG: hypothetical protein ACREC9_15075 [Methylocella sp.]